MNNEKKDNCSKYSLVVRIYVSEWLGTQDMVFSTLKKRVNNVLIFLFLLVQLKSFSVHSASFFLFSSTSSLNVSNTLIGVRTKYELQSFVATQFLTHCLNLH